MHPKNEWVFHARDWHQNENTTEFGVNKTKNTTSIIDMKNKRSDNYCITRGKEMHHKQIRSDSNASYLDIENIWFVYTSSLCLCWSIFICFHLSVLFSLNLQSVKMNEMKCLLLKYFFSYGDTATVFYNLLSVFAWMVDKMSADQKLSVTFFALVMIFILHLVSYNMLLN